MCAFFIFRVTGGSFVLGYLFSYLSTWRNSSILQTSALTSQQRSFQTGAQQPEADQRPEPPKPSRLATQHRHTRLQTTMTSTTMCCQIIFISQALHCAGGRKAWPCLLPLPILLLKSGLNRVSESTVASYSGRKRAPIWLARAAFDMHG